MRKALHVLVPVGMGLIVSLPAWAVPEPAVPEPGRAVLQDHPARQLLQVAVVAQVESGKEEQLDHRAQKVLREYRARWAEKESVAAAVERLLGKTFADLTDDEYARFMTGLDLNQDDDLWKWSHVTRIPIVGLSQKSSFFYANAHLMEDTRAAVEIPHAELIKLQTVYDPANGQPTLTTADGRMLLLREIPAGTMRRSARTGRFSHDEGFVEARTVLEVLAPYLVSLGEIPNRQAITMGLQALPLSVVKAYRGKAIYFTTQRGRSYAVGMPVSNSIYEGFAGMQAGFFLDYNRSSVTTHNLVHELGHVFDYTVIAGRYGSYLHPYQFPAFRELKADKDRIFGKGSDKVPQTDHGYVSRYARANAQESFAEHFAFYVLKNEQFLDLAQTEESDGHPGLMEKYLFLETLLERTPVTSTRLSRAYLTQLEESGETR